MKLDTKKRIDRWVGGGLLFLLPLRPLVKRLSVEYALSVGAEFGPLPVRRFCGALRAALPAALGRTRVPFMLGEILWVALRQAEPASGGEAAQ